MISTNAERILYNPYWVQDPLAWRDKASEKGIAYFALEGRPGLFNLGWLMLNCDAPPPLARYSVSNLQWVVMSAPTQQLGTGKTLEHLASFETLAQFHYRLAAWPYRQHSVMLTILFENSKAKLKNDLHRRRTAG